MEIKVDDKSKFHTGHSPVDDAKLGEVKGLQDTNNEILSGATLTITNKAGKNFEMYIPYLEQPDSEMVDLYFQNKLLLHQEKKTNDKTIEQTNLGVENLNSDKIMNDMYQIMNLFCQVFQQQRKNAREMRNAERDLQMAAIDRQAQELRSAATTAMVTSFVSAAVTIGMSIGNIKTVRSGVKQQMQLNKINAYKQTRVKMNSLELKMQKLKMKLKQPDLDPKLKGQLKNQLKMVKDELASTRSRFNRIGDKISPQERELLLADEKTGGSSSTNKQVQLDSGLRIIDGRTIIAQGVAQTSGGLGQGLSQIGQANAEKEKGEATQHETKAQDEQDWMNNMRDMLKDIAAKLQAIQQSQSETMRTIFRA